MSPEATALVRESWPEIAVRGDAVCDDFYARLFALDPEARALFAHVDMATQRAKFMQMIGAMIDVLDDPGVLVSETVATGRRHAGYGATRRDFELAGSALLQAIGAALGDRWTPAMREAWRELYVLLSSVMMRAGGQATMAAGEH